MIINNSLILILLARFSSISTDEDVPSQFTNDSLYESRNKQGNN